MRCGCYLLLAAIGLTINGGQGIYEWSSNRKQSVVTLEQFNQQKPGSGWFKVTNCVLDVQDAMWTQGLGDSVNDVYIPVHSAKNPDDPKTTLLLEVHDEKIVQTVKDMAKLQNDNAKDEDVLKYVITHADQMQVKRNVEGTIKFGIDDLQSKEHQKLAELNPNLDPSFAVLNEGGQPSILWALLKTIGGVIGVGLVLAMLASGKDEEKAPENQAPSAGSNPPTNPPDGNGPLGNASPFDESTQK